jgi:hypothetical protein
MLTIKTNNLQQAFEMSVHTWTAVCIIGLASWLLARYVLKLPEQRVKFYSVLAIFTGVYATITSTLWLYYFNVLLCFPFFALLLFFIVQLWKIDRSALGTKIALWLLAATVLLYVLAGWFFGVLF